MLQTRRREIRLQKESLASENRTLIIFPELLFADQILLKSEKILFQHCARSFDMPVSECLLEYESNVGEVNVEHFYGVSICSVVDHEQRNAPRSRVLVECQSMWVEILQKEKKT